MALTTLPEPGRTRPAAVPDPVPEPVPPAPRPLDRWLPAALATTFFVLYAALSVQKHRRLETTGYDLGIFEQGVRGYADGHWPVSHLRGLNLLGDHFSPIMALLAPLYRVVPGPVTLLVAQAALLALSIVPVTRLAVGWFGTGAAFVVGTAYGASWGLQNAVAFDVHEIAFAVPLLAFCVEALARRRWHRAIAWALPLVLVKEDLPLTVIAVGLYVALHGRVRLGTATVVAAGAVGAIAVLLVIPSVNPAGVYGYLATAGSRAPVEGAWLLKLTTVVLLLAPTAFVALRSPLVLLVAPTLAWRFASDTANYWTPSFHYDAVLMPIVFVAFLDGLVRLRLSTGRPVTDHPVAAPTQRPPLVRRAALAWCAAVTIGLFAVPALHLPLDTIARPDWWQLPPRSHAAQDVLAQVPDGARVAATNGLAPQLTDRAEVHLFPLRDPAARPDWVAADVGRPSWPQGLDQLRRDVDALQADGYSLVDLREGIALLRRSG